MKDRPYGPAGYAGYSNFQYPARPAAEGDPSNPVSFAYENK